MEKRNHFEDSLKVFGHYGWVMYTTEMNGKNILGCGWKHGAP